MALEETFSTSRSTYAVEQPLQPQAQPLRQTLLATSSGTASTTGMSNSRARNQSQGSEAKRKHCSVREDSSTADLHETAVKDAATQGGDDVSMGEPHLLIEAPNASDRDQEVTGMPEVDVPMVEEGHSNTTQDQPSITDPLAPSNATGIAALSKDADHVQAEKTVPHIETIQSSFDGDSQVSDSLGPLHTSTPDTSFASRSSNVSQRELSSSTGSSSRAPSVPCCRPEVSASTSTRRPVQMVLSTAGASWNLRRDVDVDVEPPRKKSRVFSEAENAANTNVCGKEKGNEGRGARQNLRSRLSLFARNGSQVVVDDLEDEEAVEPDGEVEVEVDELQEEDEPTNFSRPRDMTGCNREDDGDIDLDVRPGDVIRNKPEVPTAIDGDIDDVPRVITGRAIKMESELIDFTRDNGHDSSRDITMLDAAASVSDKQSQRSGESVSRPEIVRSADGESVSMRFDLFKVSETWRQIRDKLSYISPAFDPDAELKSSIGQDAGVSNLEDDERAADALSRVIDKEDFGSMEITGQFNLGFIVTRRRKAIDKEGRADMDDLFIVDQHAADEKYNFETLQQTTRIKSQKLFRSVRIWTVGEMWDID